MRVLGIDYGSKRIGVALSDEMALIAQPVEFVPAEPLAKALERLAMLAREREVGKIVVGLPRNMNGDYGPAAEKTRAFIEALKPHVTAPIVTWDERLTSVAANRALIDAGMSREKRRTKVDQTAAAILLQSFLDREIKLTIAYDGASFAGWQTQKVGLGVQQVVEETLLKVFGETFHVRSSSRTDAGVHALGMVADVELPNRPPGNSPRKLALALNAWLPPEIRVMSAARAKPDFDARFQAKGKQYRYFIWNAPSMNPLTRRTAWHVARPLNLPAMRAAAKLFVGRHDFKSLAGTREYEMKSTVRTVTRCQIQRRGPAITVIIEGDGFLYKMCRGIVGTLAQIGEGKIGAGEVSAILEKKDRRAAGMTAPAHGLVLWKVFY